MKVIKQKSAFFAFLRRLRFIRRWGLMRNTEVENNQEHSLDVAFIAHNLGLLHNLQGGAVDVNRLAVLAMYHDVSEILLVICLRLLSIFILLCANYMVK